MKNIPVFKCRASCAGKIMTQPKGKSNLEKYNESIIALQKLELQYSNFKNKECKSALTILNTKIPKQKELISKLEKVKDKTELSETCKQYLKEWILSVKYGRTKEFSSKYTEKGIETEQEGLKLIQDVQFGGKEIFINKNETNFEDEYFTGTPDNILLDWVIDNKSSWDIFTFPFDSEEIPTEGYEYQGRIYLRLTNRENFLLCYTLNDTPLEIVMREFEKYCYNIKKGIDYTDQEYYEFCKNHIFTIQGMFLAQKKLFKNADISNFLEIPKEKRYKSYLVVRDLEIEEKMIQRVKDCREWIKENWDKY